MPYGYPESHRRVQQLFAKSGGVVDAAVASELRDLCEQMVHRSPGGGTGVVVKVPHLQMTPEQFRDHFPDWGSVWLIRNPLKRLNSLYTRRWNHFTYDQYDLEATREFIRRWLSVPASQRLVYEHLHLDPAGYFHRLFEGWGRDAGIDRARAACDYRDAHYHESSAELHHARSPSGVLSDHRRHVPLEAVECYLSDPLIRALFDRLGWDTNPATYSEEADGAVEEPLGERIRQPPVGEPALR